MNLARPGPFALRGLSIGHADDPVALTGCTVLLFEGDGARAAVDVRGGAPGTRESAALSPENLVPSVHAILLTGGSAFGLDAAGGVMRRLEEAGRGFRMAEAVVPIVPAAVIYDLRLGSAKVRPDAAMGALAVERAAPPETSPEGNVGAGMGASVGKALGLPDTVMKGGTGLASAALGPHTVGAVAIVNAWGDVVDPASGAILAGALQPDGRAFLDTTRLLASGDWRPPSRARTGAGSPGLRAVEATPDLRAHTTLATVITDAPLGKGALLRVAKMAQDGLARAIRPAHTPFDGDVIYAASTAPLDAPPDDALVMAVGTLAAEVVAAAVLSGVRAARSVPGAIAQRDVALARGGAV